MKIEDSRFPKKVLLGSYSILQPEQDPKPLLLLHCKAGLVMASYTCQCDVNVNVMPRYSVHCLSLRPFHGLLPRTVPSVRLVPLVLQQRYPQGVTQSSSRPQGQRAKKQKQKKTNTKRQKQKKREERLENVGKRRFEHFELRLENDKTSTTKESDRTCENAKRGNPHRRHSNTLTIWKKAGERA